MLSRVLRVAVTLAVVALLAVPASTWAATPHRSTHWLSLINTTHEDPTDMTVIIVPPAYVSVQAMVFDTSWVSTQPVYTLPATQAALEAVEYWEWALEQYADTYPNAAQVSYTTKVLGHDALPGDLADADIIINTAMVTDPLNFLFHLGVGLPTWPPDAFLLDDDEGMSHCTVWNTGAGSRNAATEPMRLRNLVIHEFGHCLAVGHTGTSLNFNHCSSRFGCFDQHPTDVMSSVFDTHRQCISNLNVQSLDEGYAFLGDTGTWRQHDGETFMLKTDYATQCLPASMHRF